MPGMLDIHTHDDVEVLNGPSLSESSTCWSSTRRGSTHRWTTAEDRAEPYGGLARMVNRNDDIVTAVFVGGCAVFMNGKATELVGTHRTPRFLRAAHKAPAVTSNEGGLASVS